MAPRAGHRHRGRTTVARLAPNDGYSRRLGARSEGVPGRSRAPRQTKDRLIGIGPVIASYMNDGASLRKAIEQLRKRTQRQGANCSVVIAALLLNGMVEDSAIAEALFGSETAQLDQVRAPGGLWATPQGATNRTVSGVLISNGILHHNFAQQAPRLWHHYKPDHPIDLNLPFPTARILDGELQLGAAQQAPHDLFGLPEDWPGLSHHFLIRPVDYSSCSLDRTLASRVCGAAPRLAAQTHRNPRISAGIAVDGTADSDC